MKFIKDLGNGSYVKGLVLLLPFMLVRFLMNINKGKL